jgi:hypothetical protein
MSRRLLIPVIVAAIAVPRASLTAQASFGVAGGYSGARGDFGTVVDAGYHLGASIGLSVPGSPVRVRAEGGFAEFNYKGPLATTNGKVRVLSGTANALVSPGQLGGAYLIGGVGLYRLSAECDRCTTSTTKGGFNGGVGYELRLTGFAVFAEARYHYIAGRSDPTTAGVKSSTQFIPISVGVTF